MCSTRSVENGEVECDVGEVPRVVEEVDHTLAHVVEWKMRESAGPWSPCREITCYVDYAEALGVRYVDVFCHGEEVIQLEFPCACEGKLVVFEAEVFCLVIELTANFFELVCLRGLMMS